MSAPNVVDRGFARNYPIRCKAQGGARPAVFNADDVLRADFYPVGSTTSACSPETAFYTARSSQNGYAQGEVSVNLTVANSNALQFGTQYVLEAKRALASSPTVFSLIAKKLFAVRDSSHV